MTVLQGSKRVCVKGVVFEEEEGGEEGERGLEPWKIEVKTETLSASQQPIVMDTGLPSTSQLPSSLHPPSTLPPSSTSTSTSPCTACPCAKVSRSVLQSDHLALFPTSPPQVGDVAQW